MKLKIAYIFQTFDRVAIYGAGKFLARIYDTMILPCITPDRECRIFDDTKGGQKFLLKTEIYPLAEIAAFAIGRTAVILATDALQMRMNERIIDLGLPDITAVDLFDIWGHYE